MGMFVAVCVCVCVCVFVCVAVCVYVCMHACMCVCVYACLYVCIHACICLYVCMYVGRCVCPCVCMNSYYQRVCRCGATFTIRPASRFIKFHVCMRMYTLVHVYIHVYRTWRKWGHPPGAPVQAIIHVDWKRARVVFLSQGQAGEPTSKLVVLDAVSGVCVCVCVCRCMYG